MVLKNCLKTVWKLLEDLLNIKHLISDKSAWKFKLESWRLKALNNLVKTDTTRWSPVGAKNTYIIMTFTDVTKWFLSLKKIKRTKLFKNIPKTLMIEFVIQTLCRDFRLSGLLTALLDILGKIKCLTQSAFKEINL